MRSTRLIEDLEAELGGISVPVYLHIKMAAGWTLSSIQDDLVDRTGIPVSLTTLSVWTNRMGYAKRVAATVAWDHRLIGQVVLGERYQEPSRAARLHISGG